MSFSMNLRAVVFLLALGFPAWSVRADETQPEQKPGVMTRITNALHLSGASADKSGAVYTKNLILNMELSPLPLKLSEARQMKVELSLTNKSGKIVSLEFPTTQRFEIRVSDKTGRQVVQWSEDQAFEPEQTIVTINPRERIQYEAFVATRDLSPGIEYVVEGSFPQYKELKIRKPVVPQK